ncbi:MAG: glycosyltransferase family 4 protein, partial [Candidatus Limnocylindrales bacterium]
MKIGLVTPYIYPVPGGVNAHVRELYENLVVRGHDVRIISSTHGPQKSSEGDIIRLGYGWSVPTNGSVGTLTVSHRYGQLVQEMLDHERFDLLHFHEPFVPFLSLQLLRFSTSVNVATFHAYSGQSLSYEFGKRMLQRFARRLHGRIAVSAAAMHFIERYFPGDYKVIPNGVDLRDFHDVVPFARWRDGTPNILYIGRFETRKGAMFL